ncbi:transcriptional repressor [Verrucomicrobium sp. BvORR106]|uniref:Fur family transcriptional regulator n=1 Tax=Verrucomicrobium sp. BvORR106 TaxID=1403819 RepID=UPI00068B71C9|nr:transcriptional repressor [Verrucomicrobium sp. BvORR106]
MKANLTGHDEPVLPADFRMTPQRTVVHEVVKASYDHPTATEVFMRAKEHVPAISLATVYNCLDTLVAHGLLKQVNLDRASSRFCANMNDHVHFHCDQCGAVADAHPISNMPISTLWKLPEGSRVTRLDIAIRGICPECVKKNATAKPQV